MDSNTKTIEQLTMEVAQKKREQMVEEIKQAKLNKEEIDPKVLAYQQKVGIIIIIQHRSKS